MSAASAFLLPDSSLCVFSSASPAHTGWVPSPALVFQKCLCMCCEGTVGLVFVLLSGITPYVICRPVSESSFVCFSSFAVVSGRGRVLSQLPFMAESRLLPPLAASRPRLDPRCQRCSAPLQLLTCVVLNTSSEVCSVSSLILYMRKPSHRGLECPVVSDSTSLWSLSAQAV